MNVHKPFAALALATLATAPAWAADTWKIDKVHSEVSFQVRHVIANVRGSFGDFGGSITTDAQNPGKSSVAFRIQAASIDTHNADRDKHLRSADFFDAEQHPEIVFESTAVQPAGGDTYEVKGNLTLHGVTKEVVLPVKYLGSAQDPWGNERAGFETAVTLNRKDYGINWNKALDQGGFVLSDDVKVSISLAAVKQKPAESAASK